MCRYSHKWVQMPAMHLKSLRNHLSPVPNLIQRVVRGKRKFKCILIASLRNIAVGERTKNWHASSAPQSLAPLLNSSSPFSDSAQFIIIITEKRNAYRPSRRPNSTPLPLRFEIQSERPREEIAPINCSCARSVDICDYATRQSHGNLQKCYQSAQFNLLLIYKFKVRVRVGIRCAISRARRKRRRGTTMPCSSE